MTNKQKYKLVRNSITKTHLPKLFDELVKGGGGESSVDIYYKAPKKVKYETLVDCDNVYDESTGAGVITVYGKISNFSLGKYYESSSSGTGTSVLDDTCTIYDITELYIPENVEKTLENVLPAGSNVEKIDLPDSLKEIGDKSFKNLLNLTDIQISNNVVSIGAEAFMMGNNTGVSSSIGNTALVSIDVPNSVTEIGENAFFGIDNINYNGSAEDDGTHWGAFVKNGYVEKPIVYEDSTKTHILKCNTNPANTTETIDIPDSVNIIDDEAFAINGSATVGESIIKSGIINVNIPNSVTSIGSMSFNNIANINYNGEPYDYTFGAFYRNKTIDLPYIYDDTQRTFGDKMLYDYINEGEQYVTLPNSLTCINENFTDGWDPIRSIQANKLFDITIPDSVSTINGSIFCGIPNVNYNGEAGTEYIASHFINKYFYDGLIYEDNTMKTGLMCLTSDIITHIEIEYVGDYFAQYIESITCIDLPNCTYIDMNAFEYCRSLTSIDLPACTYINERVFNECNLLTSISLPSCIYIGPYAFKSCGSLTSIDLPNCINVNNYAFLNCQSLAYVYLPNCTYIGDWAFQSCYSLTSISLPQCTYINTCAFQDCQSLAYAVIDRVTIPYVGSDSFESCPSLTAIFVPDTCVTDYKNDTNWSVYNSLITGISYM